MTARETSSAAVIEHEEAVRDRHSSLDAGSVDVKHMYLLVRRSERRHSDIDL